LPDGWRGMLLVCRLFITANGEELDFVIMGLFMLILLFYCSFRNHGSLGAAKKDLRPTILQFLFLA